MRTGIALITVLALVSSAAEAQLVGEGARARVEVRLDSGPGVDCRGELPIVASVVDQTDTVDVVVGAIAAASASLPPWPAAIETSALAGADASAKWSVTGDGPLGARATLVGLNIENGHVVATAEYRTRVRVEDPMNPGATDPITVNIDFALEGVSAVVDFSGVPEAAPCARIFARMDVDGAPVFLGEAVVERGGTVRLGGMNGLGGQGNPQGFGLADFTAVMVDTSIFGPTDGRATQVSHTHQLPTSVGSEYEVAVTLVTDAFVGLGLENEVINDHFDTLGLRFEALDQGGNPLPNIRFLAVPPLPPTTFTLPPLVVADALAEKALNNPFNAFSETDSDSAAWNLTSEAFARAEAGSIPAGSGQGATGAVAEAELPAQGEFGFREVRVHARAAASGPPDQGRSPDEGGHSRASGSYRLNIVPEYTGTGSSPALIPIDLDVALTGELGAFLVPDSCGNCGPANAPAPEDMTARVDVEVFVHLGTERNRVFFAYASLDRFSPTSGGDSAVRIIGPWKNESGFTVGPASLAIDHRKLYLDQALVPFGPFGVELVVTADARSDFTTTRYTRVDTYADFFDTGSLGVGTSAADVTLRLEVPEPAGALGQAVALIVLGSLRRRGPAGA